ncbi:hypothetical protein BDBG_16430 [Blastomyces gilchristii SLH14081]|uniref:Uncharacterized protein n=1 Tax=Blastomyces gilchristii (strain SLH14081) TaxID=559298 RepID=A0A179UDQ2_BLAGS|nr:uncharacterized protein BDBG_16430 [Blastomyces gilchristii SLH14081]OAT05181.1 hypothetical protein BDBG_16430 [Blastomyces gilchristii SLH14081]
MTFPRPTSAQEKKKKKKQTSPFPLFPISPTSRFFQQFPTCADSPFPFLGDKNTILNQKKKNTRVLHFRRRQWCEAIRHYSPAYAGCGLGGGGGGGGGRLGVEKSHLLLLGWVGSSLCRGCNLSLAAGSELT